MAAAGDAHAYHGVDVDVVLRSLPPVLRAKLKAQGFRSDGDFIGIQPLELSSEARISHDDALLVLQELHGRDTGVLGQSNVQSVGIGELERLEERCAASGSPTRSTRSPHKNTRDPTLVGEGVIAIESPLLTLSPARRASLVQQAKEIFDKERRKKTLVTFCQDLDQILGGGIRTGQITEFCGAPGVGKTQIMMQLAINVQMPAAFNGLGGEAVYVDTEGSFAAKRCLHMASAFAKHLEKVALRRKDDALLREARQLDPEGILDRIHYFRARDATELLAVVDVLPSFVQDHPNVKIVIIDSIAFHFRQDFDDIGARTRRLIQMGQSLMELAHARDLAVVMTNHVTTKIMGEGKSRLVGIERGLHSLDRCLTRSLARATRSSGSGAGRLVGTCGHESSALLLAKRKETRVCIQISVPASGRGGVYGFERWDSRAGEASTDGGDQAEMNETNETNKKQLEPSDPVRQCPDGLVRPLVEEDVARSLNVNPRVGSRSEPPSDGTLAGRQTIFGAPNDCDGALHVVLVSEQSAERE